MNLAHIYAGELPAFLKRAADSPAMRRIDAVGMNCGCEYTAFPQFKNCRGYSRGGHSLGVALILWEHTKDKKQALAGLFHDIATPVFAHVIDFLRGDYLVQEATEAGTRELIEQDPVISALLKAENIPVEAVCDYHLYPAADNDSPRLCADRLEYTLGNIIGFGFDTEETVRALYADITLGVNEENAPELMFRTPETALRFAELSLRCSRVYVADADRYVMQHLAELMAEALRLGILTENDLYTTEPQVLEKLGASALAPRWSAFTKLSRVEVSLAKPAEQPELWRNIPAKKRCIDPYISGRGRVSALYPAYGAALKEFKESSLDYWVRGL